MARQIFWLIVVTIGLFIIGNWLIRWQKITEPKGVVVEAIELPPPLTKPDFEARDQARRWLSDNDEVVGVVLNGQARAYPTQILQYHELVNDVVGKTPIAIWYYPPTGATTVWDRTYNDQRINQLLDFETTNLVTEKGPVARDKKTRFRWNFAGQPFKNPNLQPLTVVPFGRYRWTHWQRLFPTTTVLARPKDFPYDYTRPPRPLPPQALTISTATHLPIKGE